MLSLCNLFARYLRTKTLLVQCITDLVEASLSASNKTAVGNIARNVSSSSALLINLTPCLYAEPLKKRKRLDPAITRQREERKKRKLTKAIKRRSRLTLNLKPVEELLIPHDLINEKQQRSRELPSLSEEDFDERVRVLKTWTKYRNREELANSMMLDRIVFAQQKALDELRLHSKELYKMAVKVDNSLIPYTIKGPSLTPPIKDYDCPDGDYIDVSFKWEP